MIQYLSCTSPFGMLLMGVENDMVVSLRLASKLPPENQPSLFSEIVTLQLQEYFCGSRKEFDLPLAPGGSPFQQLVWQELRRIPYGQIRTYAEIATAIGKPGAARAVGMACNRNPLWIVIPCHRVVGKNGSLTGYAGGLDLKRFLLELEQCNM